MEFENFRKAIPNSYELSCRNNFNRESIKVSLNCKEASFNRVFTPKDISVLQNNVLNERSQFVDFCKMYPEFKGIFYPQIKKDLVLTEQQLQSFDFIQDISESKIRIILQRGLKIDFEEFKDRIINFSNNNLNKRNIPVLRIDAKTKKDLILLDQKLRFIRDSYKECIVIYANFKAYKSNWELVSSRLSGINWYVFELPISEDNGFSLMAFCFSLGAKAVSHKRYTFGRNATAKFLNTDFTLKELNNSDNGLESYNGKNRKSFLKDDGRKTYIYSFSRWDRIVQANKICLEELRNLDLSKVISFQKAYSHFTN